MLARMLSMLAVVAVTTVAYAESLRCECCTNCRQVCRLVETTKKEIKYCYDVKCEDFCLPGRSCKIGEKCVDDPCTCRTHRETVWQPSCGQIRTKAVLVKTPVTIEKKVYKCVVEKVCGDCGTAQIDQAETERLAALPELPANVAPAAGELTVAEYERLVSHQVPVARSNEGEAASAAKTPVARGNLFQRLFGR